MSTELIDPATDRATAAAFAKQTARREAEETSGLGQRPTPSSAPTDAQAKRTARADQLRSALITGSGLLKLPLNARPAVLGTWLKEGDLGYLFAPRGHGKTWMAMLMALAISEGVALGEWAAGLAPRRVLYFDAEMNLADVQSRARLIGVDNENFLWIQNERVFDARERSLNIADADDQVALSDILLDGDILVVDNLSTGASGLEENNNDDFDRLKEWLLSLRKRRITVIIVHHAGKNGAMRGASRREDMAHWIVSLRDDTKEGGPTAFITTFVKCRNCSASEAPPLRWTLQSSGGTMTYTSQLYIGREAMMDLIQDGIDAATDLAEEMGVSAGTVSKWAKKLKDEGLITISHRRYILIEPDQKGAVPRKESTRSAAAGAPIRMDGDSSFPNSSPSRGNGKRGQNPATGAETRRKRTKTPGNELETKH